LLKVRRIKVTETRERRAATLAEIAKVLKAAGTGPELFGLTGKERGTLYRVALNTGFRASELASLTPASFHLGAKPPYVFLTAKSAKNKTEVDQPLPTPLVGPLKAFLKGLVPTDLIWPGDWYKEAAEMLRADLAAADIPYHSADGILDFHALRTTFISNLALQGVHPKKAQQLARHSDIKLTMEFYTKLKRDEVAADLPCI
jgi:integrase/recombinase XerD